MRILTFKSRLQNINNALLRSKAGYMFDDKASAKEQLELAKKQIEDLLTEL